MIDRFKFFSFCHLQKAVWTSKEIQRGGSRGRAVSPLSFWVGSNAPTLYTYLSFCKQPCRIKSLLQNKDSRSVLHHIVSKRPVILSCHRLQNPWIFRMRNIIKLLCPFPLLIWLTPPLFYTQCQHPFSSISEQSRFSPPNKKFAENTGGKFIWIRK